jgi:DNA ligase-associated metallophosphoesterase
LTVELAGETLLLLPEKALYWPRSATLFVADAHWGKAAAFRAASLALPGGTTSADLARLSGLLQRFGAQRLVLLGDVLHAKASRAPRTLEAVAAWRERHAELDVLLVRGNHDERAGDPPPEWRFTCVHEPHPEPPFVFCHHPATHPAGYVLAGHLHPAVELLGAGRQRERLPCFHFGPGVGVLPAFGSFTGTALVRPLPGDRVFVVAEDEVVSIER